MSGEHTFNNLKILTTGTFTLEVSSTDMTTVQTDPLIIINYAKTMTITSSNLTPSVNLDFTINVALKGDDNEDFIRTCSVTLSDGLTPTTLAGETTLDITTGSKDFIVYFTQSGVKSLVASCAETGTATPLQNSIEITVQKLKIGISTFTPVFFI